MNSMMLCKYKVLSHCSLVSLALLVVTGCTFADGDPWGELVVQPTVSMSIPASRVTPEGTLKTSSGFALRLESIAFEVDAISIAQSDLNTEILAFDPAAPPPGYSLCHNGHCHADDGRLVDYEEIAASLATSSSAGGLSLLVLDSADLLAASPQPLSVDLCSGDSPCTLERTRLNTVSLNPRALRIRAQVFDLRAENVLPPEGVAITLDLDLVGSIPFASTIDIPIDEDEPLSTLLQPTLEVSEKLFDGILWDALATNPTPNTPVDITTSQEWTTKIASNLVDESTFSVSVNRQ